MFTNCKILRIDQHFSNILQKFLIYLYNKEIMFKCKRQERQFHLLQIRNQKLEECKFSIHYGVLSKNTISGDEAFSNTVKLLIYNKNLISLFILLITSLPKGYTKASYFRVLNKNDKHKTLKLKEVRNCYKVDSNQKGNYSLVSLPDTS